MNSERTSGAGVVLGDRIYAMGGVGNDMTSGDVSAAGDTRQSDVPLLQRAVPVLQRNWHWCPMLCLVRGVWCMVHGAWCVVLGAWCLVLGAWCVVRGAITTGASCLLPYLRSYLQIYSPDENIWTEGQRK